MKSFADEAREITQRMSYGFSSPEGKIGFDEAVELLTAANQRSVEEGVRTVMIELMTTKTEGLFDNHDLFIKRAPLEPIFRRELGDTEYERLAALRVAE